MTIVSRTEGNPYQTFPKNAGTQSGNHTFSLRAPSIKTLLKVTAVAVAIILLINSIQGARAQQCMPNDNFRVTGPNGTLVFCTDDYCKIGLSNGPTLEVHPNGIKMISASGYVMKQCPEASPSTFTTNIDGFLTQVNYNQTSDITTRYNNWVNAGFTHPYISDEPSFIQLVNQIRTYSSSQGCTDNYCSKYGDIKAYSWLEVITNYIGVFGFQPLMRNFQLIGIFPGTCA